MQLQPQTRYYEQHYYRNCRPSDWVGVTTVPLPVEGKTLVLETERNHFSNLVLTQVQIHTKGKDCFEILLPYIEQGDHRQYLLGSKEPMRAATEAAVRQQHEQALTMLDDLVRKASRHI